MYHSIYADGEKCTLCANPADRKIGEHILDDNPLPHQHGLTAYVCNSCFDKIFSPYKLSRSKPDFKTMYENLQVVDMRLIDHFSESSNERLYLKSVIDDLEKLSK